MEWGVLGPVEVRSNGEPVAVGGSRERLVLARLLLNANRVVSQETLLDDLWEGDPPEGAAQALWVYVSRLRKALRAAGADGVLETQPPGYRLRVGPGELDAERFETLVAEARSRRETGDLAQAATLFREALGLWRGPALGEVAAMAFGCAEAARLDEARLGVLEERIAADLDCGRHGELVGELTGLTRDHPLRERLWAQRMLALYRTGRQVEALRVYQDLRRYLGDELGIEPTEELRTLEGAILRQEPHLNVDRPEPQGGTATSDYAGARVTSGPGSTVLPLPLPLRRSESSVFVGREVEMARLAQGWKAVRAGERRLILLAGEPGIGKTRLAAEIAQLAHADGATVLFGRCEEGMGVPYQPFVEALTWYLNHTGVPALGPLAGELSRLVPEIRLRVSDLAAPVGLDPETDRYRLFQAVVGWLRATFDDSAQGGSEAAGTVLVIDDLHWATPPTLALLSHITRSADRLRLLVVATYRDTDLDVTPELSDSVANMLRFPGVERLRVPGLDEAGVAAFLEANARHALDEQGRALVPSLHRETGGNPFFVGQVMRHLTETGAVSRSAGRWVSAEVGIPDDLADVISRRLARLPEETRDVLAQAAVLGETFNLAELVQAVGAAEISVLRALDPAIAARLLADSGTRRAEFRFVHALVRGSVYDSLPSARRLELHGRAGRAVEVVHGTDLEEHLPALAYHYARSGSADRDDAIDYSVRAGDHASTLSAHREAAGWYRQAAELLDARTGSDPARRCDVLIAFGSALRLSFDPAYLEALSRAVALADQLDDAERLARAAIAHSRGAFGEVFFRDESRTDLYRRAIASLGHADSPFTARLLALLASELAWAGTTTSVLGKDLGPHQVAAEALAMAGRLQDPATASSVFATAWPTLFVGDVPPDALQKWRDEIGRIAEGAGEPLTRMFLALAGIPLANMIGDQEKAQRYSSEIARIAAEAKQPFVSWLAGVFQAGEELLAGRLETAESLSRHAFELGEQLGARDAYSIHMGQLFWIRYEQDRLPDIAEPFLRGGLKPDVHPLSRAYACVMLCRLGREAEVRPLFEAAVEELEEKVVPAIVGCVLSDVASAVADTTRAARLYRWLATSPQFVAMGPYSAGPLDYHRGMLASVLDDTEAAVRHFSAAVDLARRMRAPTWTARSQMAWAAVLVRRGRPEEVTAARDLAAEALATAGELGLGGIAERARTLLEAR